MIEIIGQKNVELVTGLVALFGENECGPVGLLVADITNHVAVLKPLSIGEAAIAVGDSFRGYSCGLEGLIEAALGVEGVAELCAFETRVILVLNGIHYFWFNHDGSGGCCVRSNSRCFSGCISGCFGCIGGCFGCCRSGGSGGVCVIGGVCGGSCSYFCVFLKESLDGFQGRLSAKPLLANHC